jgi:type IV secretion system protein TrbG
MTTSRNHRAGSPVPSKAGNPIFRKNTLPLALLSGLALTGCAHFTPPAISYDDAVPAKLAADPPAPVTVVPLPEPLPLPGQLMPLTRSKTPPQPGSPILRVNQADAAARVQPDRNGFINAVQVYPYSAGALYQVYAAPGEVTDIMLETGEQLAGSGPIAAGDTVRWIVGNTTSGAGATQRIHILVKPTRPDIETNMVINTDRRTYLIELHATQQTYMASVSWQYPEDELFALRQQNAAAQAAAPIASGIDISALNFRYRIEGDNPPWRPLRAFDDGSKVYIEFPTGIAQGDMPPLFIVGPAGGSELVNYRVRQNYYVVDQLFAAAELRLGDKDSERVVRIVRTDGRPQS